MHTELRISPSLTLMSICTRTHIRTHTDSHTDTHTRTHTHTHTHTDIQGYTHTDTHTDEPAIIAVRLKKSVCSKTSSFTFQERFEGQCTDISQPDQPTGNPYDTSRDGQTETTLSDVDERGKCRQTDSDFLVFYALCDYSYCDPMYSISRKLLLNLR